MKKIICITFALALCILPGCTIVSANRVFPKPTWYWSAEAKQQRADKAAEKQREENQAPPK